MSDEADKKKDDVYQDRKRVRRTPLTRYSTEELTTELIIRNANSCPPWVTPTSWNLSQVNAPDGTLAIRVVISHLMGNLGCVVSSEEAKALGERFVELATAGKSNLIVVER